MGKRDDEWKRELTEELRRAGEELALGLARGAADGLSRVREQSERKRTRRERERAEREAKLQRRAARRAQRELYLEAASGPKAAVYTLAAAALVTLAFTTGLWWMVFVALGMALAATNELARMRVARRRGGKVVEGAARPVSSDPRVARIDEVCDKLAHALKEAPQGVRDFLSTDPEKTVASLRNTCHDLLRREDALRKLTSPEEEQRLGTEYDALRARLSAATDDVVRERLGQAFTALEQQRAHHAQLRKSADRLEAERVRLGYTLEGLYAQMMRVRSADAADPDITGAGLRLSVEQLRSELSALADAAEQVNRLEGSGTPERVVDVGGEAQRGRGSVRERS